MKRKGFFARMEGREIRRDRMRILKLGNILGLSHLASRERRERRRTKAKNGEVA